MTEVVLERVVGRVVTLTLNRPDAYNAIKARAEAARLRGSQDEAMRLDEEAMAMARFVPVMQHRLDRGPPVIFHPQMLADFSTIIEMGTLLLDQLDD